MTLPRIGALVLVVATALLLSWLARTPSKLVEVATTRRAELSLSILTNGKIEPIEAAEVRQPYRSIATNGEVGIVWT